MYEIGASFVTMKFSKILPKFFLRSFVSVTSPEKKTNPKDTAEIIFIRNSCMTIIRVPLCGRTKVIS